MANNYVQFCEALSIPPGSRDKVQAIIDKHQANEEDDDNLSGVGISFEDDDVIFDSDEYGSVDAVINLVQEILDTLSLDTPFTIQWAFTCSKSRVGEFGGGAAVVRRGRDPVYIDTGTWVTEQLNKP